MAENQQNDTPEVPDAAAKPKGPITTTLESPETWKRIVKAEIAREHYDKEFANRLKKAVKGHQKPGFRKGRTPKAVVEKEMGDMLRMETIEGLVPTAWMTGVIEHKLSPITDPSLENLEFGEEGPLKFDLVVEVRPNITVGDVEGIKVKRRASEVTDKDVDDVLTRLQESRAAYEKVDRVSETDDQISLDLVPGAWEGQADEGKVIADQKFVLGAASNMPAFNEKLLGVSAGDEKVVEVVYPDDHPNESLKGQTIAFTCQVKEVAAKVLPELTDELAAEVAGGKTLAELKEEIRSDLGKEADKRVAQELDAQIQAELIKRHDVELPPSMIEKYLESGLQEMQKRNAQMGRASSPEEEEEYRTAGRPHAEKALKGMMLLEEVRQKEDIKVTAEDVDERIEEVAAENSFDVDKYRDFVNSGDEKERLEYDLRERKTYDFLLSRAVIEDVSADTEVLAAEEE
ncbi:MAG: trigger factor [Candidatus Krumholzibacteria bacterium]|nr:trigger factor [Candidatus Krumholzibacteria bacterium]